VEVAVAVPTSTTFAAPPGGVTAIPGPPAAPEVLGTITIEASEVFCDLISAVYGFCTHSIMDAVLAQNPGIRDPGLVLAGTSILFPAPPFSLRAGTDPGHVIVLSTWKNLADAYAQVRRFRQGDFPSQAGIDGPAPAPGGGPISRYSSYGGLACRILPVWSPALGAGFHVILDKLLDSREDAMAAARELPEVPAPRTESFADWDKDTLIYAKRN
jgi:phage tail protein X